MRRPSWQTIVLLGLLSIAMAAWWARAAAPTEQCVRSPGLFHKGFTLGGWSRDDYARPTVSPQIDALARAGVEWVALTPHWFQDESASTALAPDPDASPSDESLRRAMRAVRERGLHVFLKPQIDVRKRGWRGEIAFESEAEWSAWFASYATFLSHYARIASEEGAELLAVGVELDGTRHREREWRRLVATTRAEFAGALVFAANWGRERDIAWWDALDYAGVDAYFPVASRADPSQAESEAAWRPHVAGLRAWADRICKPVLFTEIGYRSVRGAGIEPWEWVRAGEPAPAEQERLYRAALSSLWDEPWLAGFYWWQWRTEPPKDPATDTEYTPQGKPALSVLESFYARERGGGAPPP